MVQTKEMKNYKTEVTDNNRIEYLHFFGIKYPFIETDGMKIASDELEYAIRNHPNSPEGFELMEEIDCFPKGNARFLVEIRAYPYRETIVPHRETSVSNKGNNKETVIL